MFFYREFLRYFFVGGYGSSLFTFGMELWVSRRYCYLNVCLGPQRLQFGVQSPLNRSVESLGC